MIEEEKKEELQNSKVVKEAYENENTKSLTSFIIDRYRRLTKKGKKWLRFYALWFFVNLALLGAGKNRDGFFPCNYRQHLNWDSFYKKEKSN